MVIAHIPAGYILYQTFPAKWKTKPVLIATLIGSIAPDFDFIFNILGISMTNHRYFITHTPLFWIGAFALIVLITRFLKKNTHLIQAFFFATFLHISLDIPTGIRVWYPFSDTVINWFPLVYSTKLTLVEHLTHPYVVTEFLIWGVAIFLLLKSTPHKKQSHHQD